MRRRRGICTASPMSSRPRRARRCVAAASRGSVCASSPRRRTEAEARARKPFVNHSGAPLSAPSRGTSRTMSSFSLRQAAQQAKTSKSTILRAVQSGRLSATRTDDGGYAIDPAELFRVYPPKSEAVATDQSADEGAGQGATASADTTGLRIRYAQIEAAFDGLKIVLDAERRRAEELRTERDRWAAQAERLALPAPQHRRGFAGWLKRA